MTGARWCSGVILTVLLLLPSPAAAQKPESAGSGKNVQITLTITRSAESSPYVKVFKIVGQDGARARMLVGWRTPIPTVSTARDEAGKPPVTNFIYQNVGVTAELMVNVLGQGKILLEGQVEASGAREGPPVGVGGEKAPLIGTMQQALKVIVTEGKKLRVSETPAPEGGMFSLDIEAVVLQ